MRLIRGALLSKQNKSSTKIVIDSVKLALEEGGVFRE